MAASGHAATRTFDAEWVEPGGELTVTIEATNFGEYAKVEETWPEGWVFLSSDLPDLAVPDIGEFLLLNLDEKATVSFTYTLRAPAEPGVYTFEGVVQDHLKVEEAVGGTGEIAVRYTPWDHCLRGDLADGLSLVVYEGGTIAELAECAVSRSVNALYALHEGAYVALIPAAPDFLNEPFAALYPDGVPAFTPLFAVSDAAGDDPSGEITPPGIWDRCLQGELGAGYSLVVYAGGSVEELDACARSRAISVVSVLHEGRWLTYRPDDPAHRQRAFRARFADGLPPVTPLVVGDHPLPTALETQARALLADSLDADAGDVHAGDRRARGVVRTPASAARATTRPTRRS